MKKSSLTFYIGMAVSLAFLGWAVAKLDFRQAFEAILRIDPVWLLPYLAAFTVPLWLRAVRLVYISEPVKRIGAGSLFSSICIGFMGNMIFPLRLGELIRVYVTAKREQAPKSAILATIIVERMFDILATALLVAAAFMMSRPPAVDPVLWGKVAKGGAAFGVVAMCGGVALFLLSRDDGVAPRLMAGLIRLLPSGAAAKAGPLLDSFRQGLLVMRSERHFWLTILYTVLHFAGAVFCYYVLLLLFRLPASAEMALVLTVFAIIGIAVPSAPGAVGTFHAGIVAGLSVYGVDASTALGVALFSHFFMFVFFLVTGGYYINRDKLTFAELRHTGDE